MLDLSYVTEGDGLEVVVRVYRVPTRLCLRVPLHTLCVNGRELCLVSAWDGPELVFYKPTARIHCEHRVDTAGIAPQAVRNALQDLQAAYNAAGAPLPARRLVTDFLARFRIAFRPEGCLERAAFGLAPRTAPEGREGLFALRGGAFRLGSPALASASSSADDLLRTPLVRSGQPSAHGKKSRFGQFGIFTTDVDD